MAEAAISLDLERPADYGTCCLRAMTGLTCHGPEWKRKQSSGRAHFIWFTPVRPPSWNLPCVLWTFAGTIRLCSSQNGKHRSRPGTALIELPRKWPGHKKCVIQRTPATGLRDATAMPVAAEVRLLNCPARPFILRIRLSPRSLRCRSWPYPSSTARARPCLSCSMTSGAPGDPAHPIPAGSSHGRYASPPVEK